MISPPVKRIAFISHYIYTKRTIRCGQIFSCYCFYFQSKKTNTNCIINLLVLKESNGVGVNRVSLLPCSAFPILQMMCYATIYSLPIQ